MVWAEKCAIHMKTRGAAELEKIVICQRMVALLLCFLPYLVFLSAAAALVVAFASRHTLKEWRNETTSRAQ